MPKICTHDHRNGCNLPATHIVGHDAGEAWTPGDVGLKFHLLCASHAALWEGVEDAYVEKIEKPS